MKWAIILVATAVLIFGSWTLQTNYHRPAVYRPGCLEHIKQNVVALAIYQSDYNGRYPLRDTWMDAILPYMKDEENFHCISFRGPEANPNLYGYCFHAKFSGAKTPAEPETAALVFDSVNQSRNASGFLDSLPKPARHGKNVIGYADTHARYVPNP